MACNSGIITFGKSLSKYLSESLVPKTWWTHGGCYTLAQALHRYLGDDRTELWGIGSPFSGTAYHVVVKVDDCFLDAEGASTKEQLLKRWTKKYPNQFLICRKLTDSEQQVLFCHEPEGPSLEEMSDRLEMKFGPSELLWRRFFS